MMNLEDELWGRSYESQPLSDRHTGTLSRRQAYEMQLSLLRRHVAAGREQSGWKVGATSRAILDQQGLTEPLFGYLLAVGEMESDATIDYDSLLGPAFECELCFTLATGLIGPDVTADQAREAVATVHPAIELVEERIDLSLDLNIVIADNIQQWGYVLGRGVPLDADLDLCKVKLEVSVNGDVCGTALGSEVLGDPIHSVVWLANKLSEFGMALRPGDRIMSGSFTVQFPLRHVAAVTAIFDSVGSVGLSSG
jgi:2-keto-4-pentenoate hydratase